MTERDFDGDDALTIERFLKGEDRAFEELVLRYQRRVYNLTLRFLREPDEAQDATQEIFVKVFSSLKSFRGDAKFSTWLYMVAANHCRNRLKYLNRRHHFQRESFDADTADHDDGPPRQFADDLPGPERQVESRQLRDLVREAIDDLGDDHREAIVLRDLQGLSYEEIAEITGQAVGTVKSRIHRARLELAQKLRPFVESEGIP